MLKLFHQQRPEKNLDEHQFGAFFKEDYEKLKTIGEGTYGKIKIATHLNGKKYAIKTTDNVPREGVALQTLREIVIMQDLAHINIMRYLHLTQS